MFPPNSRSKNTVNIITKNMLDCLVAGVAYWAIGWAVAYGPGGNSFIGGSNFFMSGVPLSEYPRWFFQFTFAATTATIVSGSIAERCEFAAYFLYSVAITGIVGRSFFKSLARGLFCALSFYTVLFLQN